MSDPHPLIAPPEPPSRNLFRPLAVVAVVALALIGGVLFLVWQSTGVAWWKAYQQAQALAAKCQQILNLTPEVRIDSRIVVAANTPKLELVTVQKQAVLRKAWSHSWLHSTKVFDIEAVFTAKAGYDLSQAFRVSIDPRTGAISANLPPPKILSLGMSDVRVLEDEDGLWNKLTAADRQTAFRELEEEARKNFESSDLLQAASQEMEKRLRDALHVTAAEIRVETPRKN